MPSPDESLDLFCNRCDFTHAELLRDHPDWLKCRHCNTPFPAAGPVVDRLSSSPAGPSERPVYSGAPYQPLSRHTASAAAQVSRVCSPFGRFPIDASVQPAQDQTNALQTHVTSRHQFSLIGSTSIGRQRRDESLIGLEKDRSALARKPAPQDRKIPVSLHFFVAEWRREFVGEFPIKTTTKIVPVGRIESLNISINDNHDNELALLQWLWATFHPREEHTLNQPIENWRICTTLDVGTTQRRPTWVKPAWETGSQVSLVKYKDMVHDGEGKEKDPRRSIFVQKSKSARAKALGVFVVIETRDKDDVEQPPPSVASDSDGDSLFLVTPRRRRVVAKTTNAPGTARSTKASSSTAPTSFAPSTKGRPSTATSSLDLTGLAWPAGTSGRLKPCKFSVDLPARGERHRTPQPPAWVRSPDVPRFDVDLSVSDDGRETFVPSGELSYKKPDMSPRPGSVGTGEEADVVEVEDDVVTRLVGRKRKRAKPNSVEADGGPKRRNKGRVQTRSMTPGVEAAATRQSSRILAQVYELPNE